MPAGGSAAAVCWIAADVVFTTWRRTATPTMRPPATRAPWRRRASARGSSKCRCGPGIGPRPATRACPGTARDAWPSTPTRSQRKRRPCEAFTSQLQPDASTGAGPILRGQHGRARGAGRSRCCSRDAGRHRPDTSATTSRRCMAPATTRTRCARAGTRSASATLLLAALPQRRYRRAYEPGCGVGELTPGAGARVVTRCWRATSRARCRADRPRAHGALPQRARRAAHAARPTGREAQGPST